MPKTIRGKLNVFLFFTNTLLFDPQYVNLWTGVLWIIEMFLSVVWTIILTAPIRCRGSIGEQVMYSNGKFLQIYILDGLKVSKC